MNDYDTSEVVETAPRGKQASGYRVGLVCPMYDERMWGQTHNGLMMATMGGRHRVSRMQCSTSLLSHTFNTLWVQTLGKQATEQDFTHFAMLHADLAPEPGWLDMLLDEMDRIGADVLSVHSPIKDARGLTSTAVDVHGPLTNPRRFTLKEVVDELPETFDAAGCGYPGRPLLVNTGCLLVDLRKEWVRSVCFQVSSRLVWNLRQTGTKLPGVEPPCWINERVYVIDRPDHVEYTVLIDPEDWDFSRQAHAAGAKVFATRKVKLKHLGAGIYPNYTVQGMWQHDDDFFEHDPVDCAAEAVTDGAT